MPQAASLAHANDYLSWTSNQSRLFGRSFCPRFATIGGQRQYRFLAPLLSLAYHVVLVEPNRRILY